MRRLVMTFLISSAGAILLAGSTGDLFSAVAAGSVEQIRELVAKGLDVNASTRSSNIGTSIKTTILFLFFCFLSNRKYAR